MLGNKYITKKGKSDTYFKLHTASMGTSHTLVFRLEHTLCKQLFYMTALMLQQ